MKIESIENESIKLLNQSRELHTKAEMMKHQLLSSEHKMLKKLGYGLYDCDVKYNCFFYTSNRYPFEKNIVLFGNGSVKAKLFYNNCGIYTKHQINKLSKMFKQLKQDERKLKNAIRKV